MKNFYINKRFYLYLYICVVINLNVIKDLFVPVFTYVIFSILMEIINIEKDLPTMTQDIFNTIGIITLYIFCLMKNSVKRISLIHQKQKEVIYSTTHISLY